MPFFCSGGCHYRGYVEGFPSSAVTLSTCSGLRGLLQFENVSYGIEPLGYSPAFEHFVYRVSDERTAGSLLASSHPESGPGRLTAEMSTKYQGAVTLESFSVLLAQLLGRSLGISYDDSRDCRCPGRICLMSPEALHVSGAKAFSSCSIGDFETFLKHNGGTCLFNRPRLTGLSYRRVAVCGNGIVERGEQCDCGAAEVGAAGIMDKCCTKMCRFKPGVKCSSGLCCNECQFKQKNSPCRPAADCDLAEFCNGSSASCPPDLYVQDGHGCEHGTGYCYKGRCQSPDLQCRRLYGRGSRGCSGCTGTAGTARVLEVATGVTILVPTRPVAARLMQVWAGASVALNSSPTFTTRPWAFQVCNNKRHCHCHPGWKPPDCLRKGSGPGGSVDSGLQLMDHGQYPQRRWGGPLRAPFFFCVGACCGGWVLSIC
uniref:ADAM metallopeptidase domain 32 n=1 Tax=Buteo japonicus TaxID=224669 RepID=A0A8C0HL43_9AVES